MVGNDAVGWVDYLGFSKASYDLLDITAGGDPRNPRAFDPATVIGTSDLELEIDTSECCEVEGTHISGSGANPGDKVDVCMGAVYVVLKFTYTAKTEHQQNGTGAGEGKDDFELDHGEIIKPGMHVVNSGGYDEALPLNWKGKVDEGTKRRTSKGSTMSAEYYTSISCSGGKIDLQFVLTNGFSQKKKVPEHPGFVKKGGRC